MPFAYRRTLRRKTDQEGADSRSRPVKDNSLGNYPGGRAGGAWSVCHTVRDAIKSEQMDRTAAEARPDWFIRTRWRQTRTIKRSCACFSLQASVSVAHALSHAAKARARAVGTWHMAHRGLACQPCLPLPYMHTCLVGVSRADGD